MEFSRRRKFILTERSSRRRRKRRQKEKEKAKSTSNQRGFRYTSRKWQINARIN